MLPLFVVNRSYINVTCKYVNVSVSDYVNMLYYCRFRKFFIKFCINPVVNKLFDE